MSIIAHWIRFRLSDHSAYTPQPSLGANLPPVCHLKIVLHQHLLWLTASSFQLFRSGLRHGVCFLAQVPAH
eukprot:1730888-Pleurochrysis_carterae.AAC.1